MSGASVTPRESSARSTGAAAPYTVTDSAAAACLYVWRLFRQHAWHLNASLLDLCVVPDREESVCLTFSSSAFCWLLDSLCQNASRNGGTSRVSFSLNRIQFRWSLSLSVSLQRKRLPCLLGILQSSLDTFLSASIVFCPGRDVSSVTTQQRMAGKRKQLSR